MQNIHLLVEEVLKKSHVRILLYETALSQFAISGELDFYNNKILLDTRQREQCLSYILNIIHSLENFYALLYRLKSAPSQVVKLLF